MCQIEHSLCKKWSIRFHFFIILVSSNCYLQVRLGVLHSGWASVGIWNLGETLPGCCSGANGVISLHEGVIVVSTSCFREGHSGLTHRLGTSRGESPCEPGASVIDGDLCERHFPSWRHRLKHACSRPRPTQPCALSLSLLSLPILLLIWLPSYPLAFAHTACCQVLVVNGLLYRSLVLWVFCLIIY